MPLLQYPNLIKPGLLPYRISTFQIQTRTRTRFLRYSHFQTRSTLDDMIKTLISTNPINLLPTALTLASSFRISGLNLEPVIADWVIFTTPSPFNRCVFLRCPCMKFEKENIVNENLENGFFGRGRVLEGKCEKIEEIEYQRVCVRTEDGGVVSLDWPESLEELGKVDGMDTTVVIVAGNAKGSMDADVQGFVGDALRKGCFPVVMNPRGCGGSPLTTPRLFTAADSDDISTAIKYINKVRPWTTLMCVGLGYGANMLTKYLAEVGELTPITAAVCIDNPFDLEEVTRSSTHCIEMDQKLLDGLLEILRSNKALFQGRAKEFNIAKALSATSVRDFDKAISMISYGFDNVEDFYLMTNTRKLVAKLKVPVLYIQSDNGTAPLFSVPRSAIAENPFTSLLLCSCHHSVKRKIENCVVLWCRQLTIEWLSAVELALLKGRHPLLKDVEISINPLNGKTVINGEPLEKNNTIQNRTHKISDTSKWFLSHMNENNRRMQLASSKTTNRILVDRFSSERDDKLNSSSNLESDLGKMQEMDLKNKRDVDMDTSQSSSTDTEESQVLQTATVVMNMLDVTMPGTLDNEQKKKVLTAMEQGETLIKALEGAVPDDVRGKLTTAVTEIMQSQKTNLKFDGLKKIGWIHNVTSEKSNADDPHPSDQKNFNESDKKTQENVEFAPKSNEVSQEKAAQASAINITDVKIQETVESSPKITETSQEKADTIDGQMHEIIESAPKINETALQEKVTQAYANGNEERPHESLESVPKSTDSSQEKAFVEKDIHNKETRKVDSLAEQNISSSSSNSEEALLRDSSKSEHQVAEKMSNVQKNENKNNLEVDQHVQSSNKPDENTPKPQISVAQALDALTGFDDSTQMAVNSVFGVLEEMIDQFEKASPQEEGDEIKNNKEVGTVVKNKQEDGEEIKNIKNQELVKSEEGDNNNYRLVSSVNSVGQVKENNIGFKSLEHVQFNKVDHVPLDVASNQYWKSPYASYLNRYFSAQMPTVEFLDLESTTDLILDPEEGHWKMINTIETGENENINAGDQLEHNNDMENIIEPSYVILDHEFCRFDKDEEVYGKKSDSKEEIIYLVKNNLLDALKIEVGRKLGVPDLKDLEIDLIHDLDQFSETVSHAVVYDNTLDMVSFPESGHTGPAKFGTIEAANIVEAISSAVLGAKHLRKVLPLGVIVGASLASLRTNFRVVSLEDDQSALVDKSRHKSKIRKVILAYENDHHADSDGSINEGHEVIQKNGMNNGNIMFGAVTAALGASALLAGHKQKQTHENDQNMDSFNEKGSHEGVMQEKNQNSLVSSLAEKAMSVAAPVVPTTSGGEVDQDRLVAILAELGQKGGILRLVGKVALLWGGIRGAVSLTAKLISFLNIAQRPLPQRIMGFVCMVLVLWSPIVIPLLPTIVQSWATKTSNGIIEYACILGLYVAITILVVLWGKRIRGYENPLHQYGLQLTSASRVQDFLKGLVGGITMVLCIHSINALLGYAQLSWPGLPSPQGALLLFKTYGRMLILALRASMTAVGISVVEELLFRSWLVEEIAADLGFYQAILLSGIAFSLSQRSLSSIPGFLLLSLALFGMKQRTHGNLSAPIGMRTGIMTTNFILQNGGFLNYRFYTPFWLASTHVWHPFEGVVGIASCALLAILLYPKPSSQNEVSEDVVINHHVEEKKGLLIPNTT